MQRAPTSNLNNGSSYSGTLASAEAQYPFINKSTLISAEVELRRLCLNQGWGAPSVHLTGQRVAASGFQVEFQASVMVIGLPTLLNGPWCLAKGEARATAASSALSTILQGAVKLPSKASRSTESNTKNSLQNEGGNVEEFPVKCNQDIEAQLV